MTLQCQPCDYRTLQDANNEFESPEPFMSYNDYRFPPYTQFSANVTNIYDDARFEIKYVRCVFTFRFPETVEAHYGAGSLQAKNACYTLDPASSEARLALQQPGKALILRGTGFGVDLDINNDRALVLNKSYDVLYGPLPSSLRFTPIGGNRSGEYVWEVEVHLPASCIIRSRGETNELNGLASFTYTINWNIDPNTGRTARITSGQIELAAIRLPRQPNQLIEFTNTADESRNLIDQWVPQDPGLIRGYQWTLSSNRRILDFVVTDTEAPGINVWPVYIINPQVNFSVENATLAWGVWVHTIAGSFVVNPKAPAGKAATAWEFIWLLINTKIDANRRHRQAGFERGKGERYEQKERVPISSRYPGPFEGIQRLNFSVTEEMFGDGIAFSFSWRKEFRIEELLGATGIWERMPLTDEEPSEHWQRWKSSVSNCLGPRGLANLRHDLNQDVVINLCAPVPAPPGQQKLDNESEGDDDSVNPPRRPTNEESSYVDVNLTVNPEEQAQHIQHNLLRKPDIPVYPADQTSESAKKEYYANFDGVCVAPTQISSPGDEGASGPSDVIIQRRRNSTFKVTLRYSALRVGYAPTLPVLESIAGSPAYLVERKVMHSEVGSMGDPAFAVAMKATYVLENPPSGDLSRINLDNGPQIYGDRYTGLPA